MKKQKKMIIGIVIVALFLAIGGGTMFSISPDVAEAGKATTIRAQQDVNCWPQNGYRAVWKVHKLPENEVIETASTYVSGGQATLTYTFSEEGQYWVNCYFFEDDAAWVTWIAGNESGLFCSMSVYMNVQEEVEPDVCSPLGSKSCRNGNVYKCDYAGTDAHLSWVNYDWCSGDETCVQSGTDAECYAPHDDNGDEPEPDLCEGFKCLPYCSDTNTLQVDGICDVVDGAAECIYQPYTCLHGCVDDQCVADDEEDPECNPSIRPDNEDWSRCVDGYQDRIIYQCVNGEWTGQKQTMDCGNGDGELTEEEIMIVIAVIVVFMLVIFGFAASKKKTGSVVPVYQK